jgi:L-ascorbate metabolism protein UlaG (beta-lactamase superfamily)
MLDPDTLDTDKGPLTIRPINHATLALGFVGKTILVDPVGPAERYAGLPAPDAILITHEHSDHFNVETLTALAGGRAIEIVASPGVFDKLPAPLKASATRLANGETGTVLGLPVEALPAHNITPERLRYHPRGLCNGYVVRFGASRVYISGDTEDIPEMRALRDIAVAFLPMNMPYTMTGAQAAEAARAFRPRIVYPFHYLGGSENEAFAAALRDEPGIEVRLRDWYA